jgi:hypothetical protein
MDVGVLAVIFRGPGDASSWKSNESLGALTD